MQVHPIKPTWRLPGTKRFKLKYDEVLQNFAFNFNLRRYSWGGYRTLGSMYMWHEADRLNAEGKKFNGNKKRKAPEDKNKVKIVAEMAARKARAAAGEPPLPWSEAARRAGMGGKGAGKGAGKEAGKGAKGGFYGEGGQAERRGASAPARDGSRGRSGFPAANPNSERSLTAGPYHCSLFRSSQLQHL